VFKVKIKKSKTVHKLSGEKSRRCCWWRCHTVRWACL